MQQTTVWIKADISRTWHNVVLLLQSKILETVYFTCTCSLVTDIFHKFSKKAVCLMAELWLRNKIWRNILKFVHNQPKSAFFYTAYIRFRSENVGITLLNEHKETVHRKHEFIPKQASTVPREMLTWWH